MPKLTQSRFRQKCCKQNLKFRGKLVSATSLMTNWKTWNTLIICSENRRDVPVGVPLELSTWHELPKYNGIQVSQLINSENSLMKSGINIKATYPLSPCSGGLQLYRYCLTGQTQQNWFRLSPSEGQKLVDIMNDHG